MEGIFIPKEFYKDKNLNGLERDVLALYKYYTEKGKNKCCSLNISQIADILNVSTRYLRMVKKHLIDLGYIRTDGGIKVTYLGMQVGSTVPTSRKHSSYQVGSTVPIKQEAQFLHKKDIKDKEEEKREMTNLDLLLDRLPENYKTSEIVEFIKSNYLDRINKLDFSDGGVLEFWVVSLKSELLKRFNVYSAIDKSTTIEKSEEDDFML